MFSHHLLAGCPPDEIALLVDQLPGCAVHVIVTVGVARPRAAMFPDDYDLTSVVERWSAAVSRPDRLHLVRSPDRPDRGAGTPFGEVIGFDTRGLELPTATSSRRRTPPACAAARLSHACERKRANASAASAIGLARSRSARRPASDGERPRAEAKRRRWTTPAEARAGKELVRLPGVLVGGP